MALGGCTCLCTWMSLYVSVGAAVACMPQNPFQYARWPSRCNQKAPAAHVACLPGYVCFICRVQGKSTLLKLMARRQIPVPENIDVLLVEQEVVGMDDQTALQAVVAADVELMELR